MSTSDPLSWVPKDFSSSGQKEMQGFIDPSVIASMAGELYGSLPKGGSVEELILSDSSITESKSLVQKTAPVKSGSILENSYGLDLSESELSRIPDGILSGSNLPSFPGGLTSKNVGIGAQPFSTSFSFLEDIRSFVPNVPGSQSIESFGFSPSLIPKVNLSSGGLDIASLKKDFPILKEKINGRELVWLDNAATTQKPQSVIDRISSFYEHENSNIHRGAHTLAARATDAYEDAREKTARFLNAPSSNEIVFVRGATEAINLVAQTWGKQNIGKNDEIIISWLEHHANIVPWQMLCSEKGARLKVIPVDETGQIILAEYERLLSPRTKLVSITQVSNALGTVTPLVPVIEQAHKFGAKVLVDGAQAVSHMPIDVQALDCDFYVFSGHKVFAPTGIGVLFGKSEVLETIPPWQGGGNMIEDVTFEKTVYQPAPFRFEAGTGNIADAVGLGAAIDYLDQIGMKNVADYEHSLLEYGTEQLQRIPGLRLIGTSKDKAGVLSFVLEGFKTEDVGRFLNQEGIAVRSGHHCAQPILRRFGLESTVRPSLALYNTCDDIDALVSALFDLRGGRTSGPL
ncbi:family 2A encapsulin nanocompartment cargo protein cysteine desulfurase [Leptospira kmetyi]|uniref:family 2A encapsulin nanocompartment cargo protein cysteine desulfurase n=1 Tax=Leptospira kmetyi TaxID=408139 RepID=UPI00028A24CE|nr:family 2A encapsulin nanocompartment cargo protein cysteine desulfurase [Leptospira kmetyi]EQA52081.1 cysteine desulfurase, SufS family [Leptospira kmetyi serovar Malaysia str. Bejo-Iso9]